MSEHANVSGTLTTFGYAAYAGNDGVEYLHQLAAKHQDSFYLIDIRRLPYCSWNPAWGKECLRAIWGSKYVWMSDLGNLNHNNTSPIKLAYPDRAIPLLVRRLQQGQHLVLLCACADSEKCHRSLVKRLVEEALTVSVPAIENQTI